MKWQWLSLSFRVAPYCTLIIHKSAIVQGPCLEWKQNWLEAIWTNFFKGMKSAAHWEYRGTVEGQREAEMTVTWSEKRCAHIEAAEGVEWSVLKNDLFFHVSHQLGADGEDTTLEIQKKTERKQGLFVNVILFFQNALPLILLVLLQCKTWKTREYKLRICSSSSATSCVLMINTFILFSHRNYKCRWPIKNCSHQNVNGFSIQEHWRS